MTEFDIKKPPTIHFSIFELDLKARELRRNGTKVKIQEQPLELLAALLEHPGEIVSRGELRRKLWPEDTFVDFDVAVSPDKGTILYTQLDSLSRDIMLVENFR